MTRDILELAQEAGWEMPVEWDANCLSYNDGFLMRLKRFAELLEAKVRADEREACAHMVEDWDLECFNYLACPRVVADAIRARGEK